MTVVSASVAPTLTLVCVRARPAFHVDEPTRTRPCSIWLSVPHAAASRRPGRVAVVRAAPAFRNRVACRPLPATSQVGIDFHRNRTAQPGSPRRRRGEPREEHAMTLHDVDRPARRTLRSLALAGLALFVAAPGIAND